MLIFLIKEPYYKIWFVIAEFIVEFFLCYAYKQIYKINVN